MRNRSRNTLSAALRKIDAGELGLIADACQSEATAHAYGFNPDRGQPGLGQLAYDNGMRILAASKANESAVERGGSIQQGWLTYALVQRGLEQGAADLAPRNDATGLDEWLAYAVKEVPARSPRSQQPALFDYAARGPDHLSWSCQHLIGLRETWNVSRLVRLSETEGGRMRVTASLIVVVLLAVVNSLMAQGCSAESAAIDVLRRQGLNLLRPARSYVTPGGMFIKSKGVPVYIDARKEVAAEPGNLIDFDATVLEEARKKAFGLGFALDFAGTLLGKAVGLQAGQSSTVSLAQIDTTGTRLITQAVDALLDPKTTTFADALRELEQKNDVFLVQEIYLTKDIELQSSTKQQLSLAFNSKAVADCNTGAKSEETKKSEATTKPEDTKKPEAAKPAGGNGAKPADTTKPADTAKPADTTKPTDTAKSADTAKPTATAAGGTSVAGGALAVCRQGEFSLKMHTPKPLPFAVRLVKLRLDKDNQNQPVIKRDTSANIKITLGAAPAELAAAPLDDTWAIGEVQRRGAGTGPAKP